MTPPYNQTRRLGKRGRRELWLNPTTGLPEPFIAMPTHTTTPPRPADAAAIRLRQNGCADVWMNTDTCQIEGFVVELRRTDGYQSVISIEPVQRPGLRKLLVVALICQAIGLLLFILLIRMVR